MKSRRLRGLRMVVFDLDGVLVDIDSSWRLVHRFFGVDNEENYEKYMSGEIDFKEFMRTDILLWGNTNINMIKQILDKAPLMKGAKETLVKLKEVKYKTAIISSGISLLANRVKQELEIDYSLANKPLTDSEGRLTGESEETVTLSDKAQALRQLASKVKISCKQLATVGDSFFDIPLFREVGLSIAFNPKDEKVKEVADVVVEEKDLTKILPYLLA